MDPLNQIDRVLQLVGEQPELFPVGQELGLELGVVQAATALCSKFGAEAYSGKISTADERKCAAVLLGLQAGISKRQIREKVGVHMYTIDAVESAAMRGGRLEPLNIRVRDELSRLVLDAAAESRSALQADRKDMESSAWLKGVATMLGISFDKNQLSIGAPTEIFEQRAGPGREAVAAWLESQGVEVVVPMGSVDASSPGVDAKSLVINGSSDLTTQVPTPTAPDSRPQVPDLEPSSHPGGGSQPAPGPRRSMVQVSRKISPLAPPMNNVVKNCMTCAHLAGEKCTLTGYYWENARRFPMHPCDVNLSGWKQRISTQAAGLNLCTTCQWFDPDPDEERRVIGICRRYPPTLGSDDASYFPEIEAGDYCGEHTPKPAP